jgi:hypothetical protein
MLLQIVDGKYCLLKWTAGVNKYVGISDSRKRGYPKMGGWGCAGQQTHTMEDK